MPASGEQSVGILGRILGSFAAFGARRPRIALWLMVLLGCAGVGVATTDLNIRTSRSDLIQDTAAWKDYQTVFGGASEMVVVVKTDIANSKLLSDVVDTVGERLEREPELFKNALWKIDKTVIDRKGLQFLSTDELQAAIRRIQSFDPVLRDGNWDRARLEQVARSYNNHIRRAADQQTHSELATAYAGKLASSLDGFLVTDAQQIRLNEQGFESPWPAIVRPELEHSARAERVDGNNRSVAYLMNDQRSVAWLHVQAVPDSDQRSDPHAPAVKRLREHLAEVAEEFRVVSPDIQLTLTGVPVLEHDELQRSIYDMLLAAVVAFVVVGVLLSVGLKGIRHPMLVLITLINSLAITFGLAALTVGHLNILSICFAAIVIGLGVDFGIHFVSRYLHLRQELYELPEALVLTGTSVGTGIFTSAATTALAFASGILSGYPGLAELGMISAIGILVCAFQTLTFLPALIALSDEKVEVDQLPVPLGGRIFRSAVAKYPVIAIALCVIGIGVLTWQSIQYDENGLTLKVRNDSNLLKLQDNHQASVVAERALAAADESLLHGVVITESRQQTDLLKSKLEELPTVARVTELSSRLPEPPTESQARLIEQLRSRLTSTPAQSPRFSTPDPDKVYRSLADLSETLKKSGTIEGQNAAESIRRFLTNLGDLKRNDQAAVLEAYQAQMAASLMRGFQDAAKATSLEPVTLAELPTAWRDRYLNTDGERQLWLLKVQPRGDLWNKDALEAFVRDVRTVAPDVTGIPVRHYESSVRTAECYPMIGLYSLAAISIFLLFDFLRPGQKLLTILSPLLVVGGIGYTLMQRNGSFNAHLLVGIYLAMVSFISIVFDVRNLRDTLLALLPPLLGGCMMLGLMALLQIDFNPLNLVILPLVLGIGVDDGIHMIHDYRRQLAGKTDEYTPSGDTLTGVLLTSLTSIVGFGSLMVSGHAGLKSVGIVLALGVTCCMAVALLLLPPMLVLVARHQPASLEPVIKRKPKVKKEKPAADNSAKNTATAANSQTAEATTDAQTATEAQTARKLSRKERRRQAAA